VVDAHVGGRQRIVSFVIDQVTFTSVRALGQHLYVLLCTLYQGSFDYMSVIVLRGGEIHRRRV
jgi:hypothetical protein